MDPTLALIACCALAPIGVGIAVLLGRTKPKKGEFQPPEPTTDLRASSHEDIDSVSERS